MAHRVTLIPGDGIGPELAEATASRARRDRRRLRLGGRRRRRGRHGRARHAAPGARPRVDQAQQGRAQGPDHDAGRGGLPERQRDPPPGARAVRQPPPGPHHEGPRDPLRGRRPRHRPREHRGPVRGHRAPRRPRRRREHQDHHPGGVGADRPLRLRLRGRQRPAQGHGRPQGQHHEAVRRAVPRVAAAPSRPSTTAGSSSRTASSTTCACSSSRSPSCTTCWCCPTCTATSCQRPGGRAGRRAGRGARRQHRHRGRGVRAGPRLGAEVRRAEQGQPDGADPERRADAPPPRRIRARRTGSRPPCARSSPRAGRPTTSADRPAPSEFADAIIDRLGAGASVAR